MTEDSESIGEPQYREAIALIKQQPQVMGLMSGWSWYDDPKRLVFHLARYKFVAKMLQGKSHVLEIGCADGFGTRIVAQAVGRVTAIDFAPEFIESARATMSARWPVDFRVHDIRRGPVDGRFDAVYSLDVLEHVPADEEVRFVSNAIGTLAPSGVALIGSPSLQSQAYASAHSREGHVNCKDQDQLRRLMATFFTNVFVFSMNDEMVHTGHSAMSHYNLALCCGPISPGRG
jgi:cyclopropane fatty-acyl-phospholipid synthase-like methyltransferase